MKIEKLHCKNINSLAGEFEIDFLNPALSQQGIFVITGPTGSGKTSILDAICFGLYARSPRQKSFGLNSSEIMTYGKDSCSATVWYEHEGVHYRSTVSHHRTKDGSDSPFRQPKCQLFRLSEDNEWVLLSDKIRDFKATTEKITGLSYDNFSRCMLLAQGDFAAFLKAAENERAEVLSTITGTGIYDKIGSLAHERYAAVQRQISALQFQPEMLPDERQKKETARDDAQKELKRTEERLDHVENCLRWLKFVADQEKKVAVAKEKADQAAQARQRFEAEQEPALKRAESALVLKPEAEALATAIKQHKQLISEDEAVSPKYQDAFAELEKKKATKELAEQMQQQNAPALQKKLKDVRTLMRPQETLLKTQESSLRALKNEDAEKQKAHLDLQKKLLTLSAELKSAQATLTEHQNALLQVQADAGLGERLPLLKARLAEWQDAPELSGDLLAPEQAQAALATAKNACDTAEKHLNGMREIAALKMRQLNIEDQLAALYLDFRAGKLDRCPCCGSTTPGDRHTVLNEEVQKAQQDEREAEQQLKQWRAKVESLQNTLKVARLRQAFCEALGAQVENLPAAQQTVKALQQRWVAYNKLVQKMQDAEKKCDTHKAALQAASARAEEVRTTAETSARRVQQAEKEFAELRITFVQTWGETATADTLEKQYQTALDKLDSAVTDAQKQCSDAQLKYTELKTTWERIRKNLPEAKSQVDEQKKTFAKQLAENGFADVQSFNAALSLLPRLSYLRELKQKLFTQAESTASILKNEQKELGNLQANIPLQEGESAETLPETADQLRELKAYQSRLYAEILGVLHADDLAHAANDEQRAHKTKLEAERDRHLLLKKVLGGDQDGFKKYAQQLTFDLLLNQANVELRKLTSRYELRRTGEDKNLLGLSVIDHELGITEGRSASNLSGGETFLVSLALALGLSRLSNATRIDSLFLDEGFGTLDADTLENVISCLQKLHATGKTIGIISHVPALRDRIPARIEVEHLRGGFSTLTGNPAVKSLGA